MKTSERRKLILDLLDQSEMVKTQELMKTFDTSESTIRRDLTVLAENGKIVRVHGGAIGVDLYNYGLTVEKRQIEYIEEKQKIAKTASAFVKDRELIFLDASTTVGEMIPFLAGKKIKAVTNSPIHAQRCYEYGIPVYVIGGELRQATDAVIGAVANQQVSEFFFNRAFMGTNGINAEFGYSTPDPEEALMKRIVMRHGNRFRLACNHCNSSYICRIICNLVPICYRGELNGRRSLIISLTLLSLCSKKTARVVFFH